MRPSLFALLLQNKPPDNRTGMGNDRNVVPVELRVMRPMVAAVSEEPRPTSHARILVFPPLTEVQARANRVQGPVQILPLAANVE